MAVTQTQEVVTFMPKEFEQEGQAYVLDKTLRSCPSRRTAWSRDTPSSACQGENLK